MGMTSLNKGADIIRGYVKTLGMEPGVYRMLSQNQDVLYVGKAKHLKNRVVNYTQVNALPHRLQRMVALTHTMEFIITATEEEALLLELQLIKKLKPRFNILLKDDKSFPYLVITKNHPAPRLLKYRGMPKEDGSYFGPFASTKAVNETQQFLSQVFRLRTCSDSVFKARTRPCLEYHIKRCAAPCVNYISPGDYQKSVQQAKEFLLGKNRHLQQELEALMQEASAEEAFEKAVIYRDRLLALNKVQSQSQDLHPTLRSADIFAAFQQNGQTCIQVFFYRNGTSYGNKSYFPQHPTGEETGPILQSFMGQFYQGKGIPEYIYVSHDIPELSLLEALLEKLRGAKVVIKNPQRGTLFRLIGQAMNNANLALARRQAQHMEQRRFLGQLQTLLGISHALERVEVYDNSHLQGTNPFGTLIVATPDGFDKKSYRKFSIRSESGPLGDDYGMMREVFTRRFKPGNQNAFPDLVIVDGGRGQFNVVQETLRAMDVKVNLVAIGKGPDRHAGEEKIYTKEGVIALEKTDPLQFFIQRIRDEAHRFAIGTHRAKRLKTMTSSTFNDIPGVGPKRKKVLLNYFGSYRDIRSATVEELVKAPGISRKMAQDIFDYFQTGPQEE